MSFVGPRPALFNQHDLVEARARLGIDSLRPGITGWAQINGRDEIPLEKKVELDREYAVKKSFVFDVKILLRTAWKAVASENISH
jgi:O-antigen biosynthesis protein WbqP